jgi:hypothetical protein
MEYDDTFYTSLFADIDSINQEDVPTLQKNDTAKLIRNRQSARRSRERARDLVRNLQERCAYLETQNAQLLRFVASQSVAEGSWSIPSKIAIPRLK